MTGADESDRQCRHILLQRNMASICEVQLFIRQIHDHGNDIFELMCPPQSTAALAAHGMQVAGWSDAGRGYRMHRPSPSHGQLIVCFGGMGRVWVDGAWTDCKEGHAYVSPPRVPSHYETVPRSRWHIAWILLESSACEFRGLLGGTRSVMTSVDPHPLKSAIEGLYRESVGQAVPLLMERWCDLMNRYVDRTVMPKAEYNLDPLRQLWAAVDARPGADWTLDRLAAQAACNAETLRVLCIRHVGRSPMQHVTHLRMRRANFLLQTTSAKLTAIAKMVGYRSAFSFSTAFKREFGVAPSAKRSREPAPK